MQLQFELKPGACSFDLNFNYNYNSGLSLAGGFVVKVLAVEGEDLTVVAELPVANVSEQRLA